MKATPICIFVYKRADTFQQVVESLKTNPECSSSPLYIFSDSARSSHDSIAIDEVRKYAGSISGFASVEVIERSSNMGLAKSIISGVTQVLEEYERVIVLEDDLLVSNNFLAYMHQCLDVYESTEDVWSVSGYSGQRIADLNGDPDIYFGRRSSSWGWATWRRTWSKVDWSVADYPVLKDKQVQRDFKRGGGDLITMLERQQRGLIDSWAIRFSFYQFLNKAFDVVPKHSKVVNLGFAETATNTVGMEKRFSTTLDKSGKRIFDLPLDPKEDAQFMKAFRAPFSMPVRLKYKLLTMFK